MRRASHLGIVSVVLTPILLILLTDPVGGQSIERSACPRGERLDEQNPRVHIGSSVVRPREDSAGVANQLLRCVALPDGATQGPRDWYRLVLTLRAVISGPATGSAVVSVLTGGAAAAQIHFVSTPEGLVVAGSSVHGVQRSGPVPGGSTEFTFNNYLQRQGVRAGNVRVELSLEQSGGVRVHELEVLKNSYLERTADPPYPLTLMISLPETVAVGETFESRYAVSWPLRAGSLDSPEPYLESVNTSDGLSVVRVGPPKAETENTSVGVIQVRAATVGPHQITVDMALGGERASTAGSTTVVPAKEGNWLQRSALFLWLVAGTVVVLPLLLRLCRR